MSLKTIKSLVKDKAMSSSCHGIPNMAKQLENGNYCLVFLWAFFFTVFSGFFYYLMVVSVQNYLNFNTVTSIDIINESPAIFPKVTICNLNSNDYHLNETIISCRFDNNQCELKKDFIQVNLGFYPNCFIFNMQGTKISNTAGKSNGLVLELFLGPIDKLDNLSPGYGFHVFVNNHTQTMSRILKGVDVSPGYQTNLMIQRVFNEKLSLPYDNCFESIETFSEFNTTFVKKILNSGGIYQQTRCFELCRRNQYLIKCNCILRNITLWECLNNDYNITCYSDLVNNFYSKYYAECLPLCPLECKENNFIISTSFLSYPHLLRSNVLLNNSIIKAQLSNISKDFVMDTLRQYVLSVCVYYDDLEYIIIKKSPKIELLDLISSIGGIMGIFLGTSFLSFIEIIDIFVMITIALLRK